MDLFIVTLVATASIADAFSNACESFSLDLAHRKITKIMVMTFESLVYCTDYN